MILLRAENASVIFRQCASLPRHGLSPRAYFLATRNISWGSTSNRKVAINNQLGGRRRRNAPQQQPTPDRTPISSIAPPAVLDAARKTVEDSEAEDNVTFSLFEQNEGDESTREEVDIGGAEALDREIDKEEQDLDERIRALEDDIEKDIGKSGLPEIPEDFADEFISPQEREEFIKSMGLDNIAMGKLPHIVEAWEDMLPTGHLFLENFNGALNEASLNPSSEKVTIELWRWYARCKIYLKGFITHIPDEAWDLLWVSQSEESPANPNRASHLRVLAEDLVKAGRTLTEEQRFSKLEGMFLDGDRDKALQEWEKCLKGGDGTNAEFLALGVQMYASYGNITRTLEVHGLYVAVHNIWDLDLFLAAMSVLFPKEPKEKNTEKAQAFYTSTKTRFEKNLKMEDYDAISLAFLKGGERQLALMVFRDMMLTEDATHMKSHSFVRQLHDRVAALIRPGQSASKTNTFMLESLKYLPRMYQNKYFFAKWLRKLISMGEVDAAATVVELMYERGIKPDALHANGVIGAWLRVDTPETRKKAEEMAWAMMQTRLNLVEARRQRDTSTTGHKPRSVGDGLERKESARVAIWAERITPPANIETFCIMVKYYLQKEEFDIVRHLRNLLSYSEIPMNSVFMNHLLYAELHFRTYSAVWARFEVMSRDVIADIETWICLWEGEKQEIFDLINPHADLKNKQITRFPKPRQLFASMMRWRDHLQGRHLRDALEDIEADTYNDVVRCFCLSRDMVGAFVAMHAMTARFQVWPKPSTVRMLLLQIAKMSTVRRKPGRRLMKPGKADVEERMAKTTEVLGLITEHRQGQLKARGIDFEKDLSESQQVEETLRTLLQLIFTVSMRMSTTPMNFQTELDAATTAMGVDHIDTEAAMASIV